MAPKVNRKRYNLADVHAQFAEAVGGEQVEFDAEGGSFAFPHPVFADEEWAEKVDAAETASEKARAMLGDEQYEKYRAAGNSDNDLGLLFMAVQQDSQAQLKKRPTR
ncbi:hypothetical protein ABZ684_21865 [Streptomyces sp. NPDC006995]|uniref:hypothetical protein n=1 Tax=Streptomyces sp. NPDC006995 TaxID=3156907 RepID=UPI0033C0F4D0